MAPIYLYRFVHDEYMREGEDHGVLGNGHIFLNLINIEARQGCRSERLIEVHLWDDGLRRLRPSL